MFHAERSPLSLSLSFSHTHTLRAVQLFFLNKYSWLDCFSIFYSPSLFSQKVMNNTYLKRRKTGQQPVLFFYAGDLLEVLTSFCNLCVCVFVWNCCWSCVFNCPNVTSVYMCACDVTFWSFFLLYILLLLLVDSNFYSWIAVAGVYVWSGCTTATTTLAVFFLFLLQLYTHNSAKFKQDLSSFKMQMLKREGSKGLVSHWKV